MDLYQLYKSIKVDIDIKLDEFSRLWDEGTDDDIFKEMVFCMCTPQTSARKGWEAATQLEELNYFYNGHFEEIACTIKDAGIRFHKNKAKYVLSNRNKFIPSTKSIILKYINGNILNARNNLVDDVTGWGMKEASHFLRNIGFGSEVCILDRHVMRRLKEYGVITAIPKVLTKNAYLEIEVDMKHFALEQEIPVDALDFVFWYQSKGEFFK